MNIYFTSQKLCHIEVNNVLFAFHNQLIHVLREEEKKIQLIDGIRIIDLKGEEEEAEREKKG